MDLSADQSYQDIKSKAEVTFELPLIRNGTKRRVQPSFDIIETQPQVTITSVLENNNTTVPCLNEDKKDEKDISSSELDESISEPRPPTENTAYVKKNTVNLNVAVEFDKI